MLSVLMFQSVHICIAKDIISSRFIQNKFAGIKTTFIIAIFQGVKNLFAMLRMCSAV